MSRLYSPLNRSGSANRLPSDQREINPESRGVPSGGSAFSPLSIAGLVAWLDVSQYLPEHTTDQTTFTTLNTVPDMSGNNHHAVSNYGLGIEPELIDASINGLPTARFTDYPRRTFLQSTGVGITGTEVTVFAVLKQNQHQNFSCPVALVDQNTGSDESSTACSISNQWSSPGTVLSYRNSTTLATLSNGNPGDEIPYIFHGSFDGVNNVVRTNYQGNTQISTPVANADVFDANILQIGARARGSLQYSDIAYLGEIGEVLLWNRSLDPTEANEVLNYLIAKWGV